jgi:peptidoglycan/xylan/chitin deacetylase (PgdA/CDA1 family)
VLTHTAPAQGLLDLAAGPRAIWQMPRTSPPTVYLTYDDGPNGATTPMLLDVLARERVHATFFLIDREITDRTVALVARMFADGVSNLATSWSCTTATSTTLPRISATLSRRPRA